MKKIINKIMLSLFIFGIALFGLTNSVHADQVKDRIYGNDRIQTSVKISENGWNDGADTAIVTQGYDYADALCAGPLAKKYNAPILISEKNALNSETINELKRLKVKKVFIIGGSGALSENVENQLSNAGIKNTERLWGKDRYETSLKVAESLGSVDSIVVVSSHGYADSLSIAPVAAQKCMPILLSEEDNLTDGIKAYIKNKNIKNSYIVGGSGVISDKIQSQLPNAKRLSGQDRFETNLAVLENFQNELNFEKIFIAEGDGVTGSEFADALSGSSLAAQKSSPIVLIYKTINSKTADFIKTKMTKDSKLVALGGVSVVPEEILNALIDLFNGKIPNTDIVTPLNTVPGSTVIAPTNSKDSFTLTVTKNNGSTTIKTQTIKLDGNKNALDYLKSISQVAELQGPGFINGIDGLINVKLENLSTEKRKQGILGIDWFIRLNGELTKTGAPGVHPKAGDTLNFDYHEWDWRALMSPNYNGPIILNLEKVPSSINAGDSIKLRATCVYRGIYDVKVKVDGKEVASTDIDGWATITINDIGTHKISVEKDGGSKEQTITVNSKGGGIDVKENLNLNSDNLTYDGNIASNKKNVDNVKISANNVSIKNVNISDELIIDPGKNGISNIENVTAAKITIKSGAEDSIHFKNVKSDSLLINSDSYVRVEALEETQIKRTEVASSSILEPTDSSFGVVTIDNNTAGTNSLELRGDFKDNIDVKGNAKITAKTNDPIPQVNVVPDSKVQLTLEGKFKNINVEKEAAIEVNNAEISKIDTNANINIKINDDKSTICDIEKAKDINVECKDKDNKDIKTIPIEEKATILVSEISLNNTTTSLGEGDTLQLNATIQPGNATNKNVIWSSSNNDVATVDESGKITAVKEGIATISAVTEDGNKTASCVVTVTKQKSPTKGTFTLLITKDNGATTLKKETIDLNKDKENENALDYLKGVSQVAELQGPGFINGIDGLVNVILKDLPIEEVKKGTIGIDWFIYLNGKITSTGSAGVHPKADDILNFDYHKWDWHALMPDGYTGNMPILIAGVPLSNVYEGDSITIKATCVYKAIYGAVVKVDGQQVATTDIDGNAIITLNTAGNHSISVEKEGGIASKSVNVQTKKTPTPPVPQDSKLVDIKSPISFTITKSSTGTLNIDADSNKDNDYIAVTLYDDFGNLVYINQSSNGKMQLSTMFKQGKYHGFVKSSSMDKIEISEFEVK